ncbi:MAG: thioredoxin [Calditrichaeota bacterium]|nr:MAG: thioredoxin [Calditrichota bacterium]MBL1206269.1 thioredoxin [Calditrichota bacterium]NOG46095.1 thioredoxin family protein [Calditrichota bacterium]
MLKDVSNDYFEKQLIYKVDQFMVFVWAPWCSNCKTMMPIITELGSEISDNFQIVKLNGDENQNFIKKYKVFGLPTTLIFSHGLLIKRKTGMQSKKFLVKQIMENKNFSYSKLKKKKLRDFLGGHLKK